MLSIFECITCCSSMSLEDAKLVSIFNRGFYVSDFLRLFMYYISFKYVLILLRYSSVDVLFLPPLLSYSIKSLFQKLPTLSGL